MRVTMTLSSVTHCGVFFVVRQDVAVDGTSTTMSCDDSSSSVGTVIIA